jgi:hypothetical protein
LAQISSLIFLETINFFSKENSKYSLYASLRQSPCNCINSVVTLDSVIISDSIAVKYVSLENAEVFCFRGANIGENIYKLERNKKMFEKYMNFIVHVGTNDVQKLSNDQFIKYL